MPMTTKVPLRPSTRLDTLSRSPLLDQLTASELAVLIRVIARRSEREHVRVTNRELHESPRAAQRALHRLAERKLIRIHVARDWSRTIEVL